MTGEAANERDPMTAPEVRAGCGSHKIDAVINASGTEPYDHGYGFPKPMNGVSLTISIVDINRYFLFTKRRLPSELWLRRGTRRRSPDNNSHRDSLASERVGGSCPRPIPQRWLPSSSVPGELRGALPPVFSRLKA
jgi:hypothetical protein